MLRFKFFRLKPLFQCLSVSLGFLLLSACASQPTNTGSLANLQNLSESSVKNSAASNMSRIRYNALKEEAMSLGAQAGLASQAANIDDMLEQQSSNLDQIFNFRSLIIKPDILPPVLVQGRNTFDLKSARRIRLSDQDYYIEKQARFVTAPPTWREYLWMDYKQPPIPNVVLLPKNSNERAVWRYYIKKGWDAGLQQAVNIYDDGLARLGRDYQGMVLYSELLAKHMVSKPYVAKTNYGITGDKNNLRINDQVLTITALPELNQDGKEWKAPVIGNNLEAPSDIIEVPPPHWSKAYIK